jgi:hypothetical protein
MNAVRSRGLCSGHLQRLQRTGDVRAHIPLRNTKPPRPCSAEGCTNVARTWGLCQGHATRMRTHGDPLAHIPLETKRPRGSVLCSQEGCDEPYSANGLCKRHARQARELRLNQSPCRIPDCIRPLHSVEHALCGAHYNRLLELGDALAGPPLRRLRSPRSGPGSKSSEYNRNHRRVRKARGPAWQQACQHCGRRAQHWATIHGRSGADPMDFMPLCQSCHFKYDRVGVGGVGPRGEASSFAKLTEDAVRAIRSRRAAGESPAALAIAHGVTADNIRRIVSFDTWKHVA